MSSLDRTGTDQKQGRDSALAWPWCSCSDAHKTLDNYGEKEGIMVHGWTESSESSGRNGHDMFQRAR